MIELILTATLQTFVMLIVSGILGLALGIPLGLVLFLTQKGQRLTSPRLNFWIGLLTNLLRSIPYIILIVLMIPLTRLIVGSSIGLAAAIVPLSLGALLLVARMAEDAFKTVPKELLETGFALGATNSQTVFKILIPESLPSLVSGFTNILIMLVGFSAMSGAVGGGGLGDLAIRYGYQRYDVMMLVTIVLILIGLVQIIQMVGDALSKRLTHS